MKGKIDINGHLWLERRGNLEWMMCPYKKTRCGDACPLFRYGKEMRNVKQYSKMGNDIVPMQRHVLRLCHANIELTELEVANETRET
jgi:hypothetical protein